MSEQNKALIRAWFQEVWNERNPQAIDRYFTANTRCFGFPDAAGSIDRDQYKAVHQQFLDSFTNIHITIDDILAEDDRVVARWTCRMDHTGDALGVPATRQPVTLPGCSFTRIQDHKIIEGHNFMDLTAMTQSSNTSSRHTPRSIGTLKPAPRHAIPAPTVAYFPPPPTTMKVADKSATARGHTPQPPWNEYFRRNSLI
jgi:steroid delta-isomerase-like uncharacterized protein